MLTIQNLVAGYKGAFTTRPLSLCASENQTVGFCGSNGAGKTTLIKTILGLHQPVGGFYKWKENYRRAYLPQIDHTSSLIPMTVYEVLATGTKMPVNEAVSDLGDPFLIKNLINQSFHQLSGGQKQKVLMTRTFLVRPEVVFLDEPNNHIDKKTREIFWGYIEGLKKRRELKGVFIIDHDLESLKRNAEVILDLEGER